jgi:hypothetical protein
VLWGSDIKKIMAIIVFFQLVSVFGQALITSKDLMSKKNANS